MSPCEEPADGWFSNNPTSDTLSLNEDQKYTFRVYLVVHITSRLVDKF